MASDLDDTSPARVDVDGGVFLYDSLAHRWLTADVPLRCPYCWIDTGLSLITFDGRAHVECPVGHSFRHPWITTEIVRWAERLTNANYVDPASAPQRPVILFRPLIRGAVAAGDAPRVQ
jgi:hypothetical protein